METSPGFRAVVFALRDLPAPDRQYIAEVARALSVPAAPDALLWDTPLLLTRLSCAPPVPGLRGDAELAAAGLSPLFIALRLLTVDALQWPELRFLGLDLRRDAPDYALYAADPKRWTVESLVRELSPGPARAGTSSGVGTVHVQSGLGPRPRRLPPSPGDRVPILGWQVPLLGGQLKNLIDLRDPAERTLKIGDLEIPRGMRPGHQQGRYALFLRVARARGLRVDVELARADLQERTLFCGTLSLELGDEGLYRLAASSGLPEEELSTDGDELATWMNLLLPGCLLCAPSGELLLVDLFGLSLSATALRSEQPAPLLRVCGRPLAPPPATKEENRAPGELLLDPHLLDPSLWPLDVLADALDMESAWVSPNGRLVRLHLDGRHDGEPLLGVVLLDTHAAHGTELVASLLDEEEGSLPVDLHEHALAP